MSQTAKTLTTNIINGFDPAALQSAAEGVQQTPAAAKTRWSVRSVWRGGTRVRTEVDGCEVGGQRIERRHTIECDEPLEVFGSNQAPNPQELLLASVGSCMSVVYALQATSMGIVIERLAIELGGAVDLRGPLGLDPQILPGFPKVECKVHIRADATREQLEALHGRVQALSPNYYHLTSAIPMDTKLVVEP